MINASITDSRELIRIYRESEWRATRLDVLRQFGDDPDARSFQFLTHIAKSPDDLAEQRLAIAALGRRKNSLSKAFLRNYYAAAPDTLKAALAHALGQVQDFSSSEILLKDWDTAQSKQDWAWLRNIVLSLGDLKAFAAVPKIEHFLKEYPASSELLFASMFALGRLLRDPTQFQKIFEKYHAQFLEDALLSQVYQSTLNTIQIRSQFKLEDYLNKIFTLPEPHAVLPLELLSFDPSEVELGLSLFSIETDWKRFLFALRGVSPKQRDSYLNKIAQTVNALNDDDSYLFFIEHLAQLNGKIQFNTASLSDRVKLKWVEVTQAFEKEAAYFLKKTTQNTTQNSTDEIAVQFLNSWSDYLSSQVVLPSVSPVIETWIQEKLNPVVYARLIRLVSELGIEVGLIAKNFSADFKVLTLRQSLLIYAEKFPAQFKPTDMALAMNSMPADELEKLGLRILAVLESFAQAKVWTKEFELILKLFFEHSNPEYRMGVIRVLKQTKTHEPYLVKQLSHANEMVVLNSIIALKSFDSSAETSESLIPFLNHASAILRGRALDSLCAHSSLKAKQAIIEHLKKELNDETVVDKIYRCFDPQNKGGETFVQSIDAILSKNPDHTQWEKLVSLRDRLIQATKTLDGVQQNQIGKDALKDIDQKLLEVIPQFGKLDPTVQSALRAAEQPFHQATDLQNLPVDKAPTVLEYCKALDLILERHLGQKYLFPRLDQKLHDFQTLWHHIGFSEDWPPADRVLTALGLKGKITPENFPLHKSKMMCATFFNGKIMQDRFKVFDGLRAWAVIFLVFTRKIPNSPASGALIPLATTLDAAALNEKCISIAKRLMSLQDLRNPAAHRQTYTELHLVKNVRNEAIQLVNTVLELVL